MYRPTLYLHWKQARLLLLPMVVACFALPLLNVQGMGTPEGSATLAYNAYLGVSGANLWIGVYPLLAVVVGVILALTAWNWDHQLGHVHALSLPIPRWKYALLKMSAGTTLLLAPTAALWLGALAASAAISLPEGLHAYPNALAFRFLLAALLIYSMIFALAAGTIRTTVIVVSAVLAFFIFGGWVVAAAGPLFHVPESFSFGRWLTHMLVNAPGPFHVFSGSWSLIDV